MRWSFVLVEVVPAQQPDRVLGSEAPGLGVEVPEGIVVQPGFGIEALVPEM